MSLKKTDLAKNMALKLDGRMKATGVPSRFAKGAAEIASQREQRRREASPRAVAITCKLPPELAKRLRERALNHDGGVSGVMAEALTQWLG